MNYSQMSVKERQLAVEDAQRAATALRAAAAAVGSRPPVGSARLVDTGGQGSPAWLSAREGLMTGSTFGNALGLRGERALSDFWEERVGLKERFRGNAATQWGSNTEASAAAAYTAITGRLVDTSVSLGIAPPDAPGEPAWLGASPDGLLCSERGVLEIKCPAGRRDSDPVHAQPYPSIPVYYMPQVLALQAVFEREFADFFVYTTANGCVLWRVSHDAALWAAMRSTLKTIWFDSVLPARAALASGGIAPQELRARFSPRHDARRAAEFTNACNALAAAAERSDFPSPPRK